MSKPWERFQEEEKEQPKQSSGPWIKFQPPQSNEAETPIEAPTIKDAPAMPKTEIPKVEGPWTTFQETPQPITPQDEGFLKSINPFYTISRGKKAFVRGIAKFGVGTAEAFANLVTEYGEMQGKIPKGSDLVEAAAITEAVPMFGIMETVQKFRDRLSPEEGKKYVEKAKEFKAEILPHIMESMPEQFEQPEGKFEELAEALGGGTASLALAYGLAQIPGAKTHAAALVFGAIQKGTLYGAMREKGIPPEKASRASTVGGAAEYILEYVGLEQIMSTKSTAFHAAAKGTLTESLQEMSQEGAGNITEMLAGSKDLTFDELTEGVVMSGIVGGILGGGMSGSLHVARQYGIQSKLQKYGLTKQQAKEKTQDILNIVNGHYKAQAEELLESKMLDIELQKTANLKEYTQAELELIKDSGRAELDTAEAITSTGAELRKITLKYMQGKVSKEEALDLVVKTSNKFLEGKLNKVFADEVEAAAQDFMAGKRDDYKGIQAARRRLTGKQMFEEEGDKALSTVKNFRNRVIDALDIDRRFLEHDMRKTLVTLKALFSKRTLAQELSLKAIQDLAPKGTLTDEDFSVLLFAAQYENIDGAGVDPETKRLWNERKDKPHFEEARQNLRKSFEGYKGKIAERVSTFKDFYESLKDRNVEEIEDIRKTLGDAEAGSMDPDLRQKLTERLKVLQAENLDIGNLRFVSIPVQYWLSTMHKDAKTWNYAMSIISGKMSSMLGRKTLLLEDLLNMRIQDKDGNPIPFITREQIDARDSLATYINYVERQFAERDIFDAAIEEGLILKKSSKEHRALEGQHKYVNVNPQKFPAFKEYVVRDFFAMALDEYFDDSNDTSVGIGKIMSLFKMWRFANPLFMPFYDIHQAAVLGTLELNKIHMWFSPNGKWAEALREINELGQNYQDATKGAAWSTPYSNPMDSFRKKMMEVKHNMTRTDANRMMETVSNIKEFTKDRDLISSYYTAAWNSAWFLDKVIRMHSYLVLKEAQPNLTTDEVSQIVAKFHGDYASVPPKTRKVLNKIFFTPTFEIVMNKLYAEMVKGTIENMATGKNRGNSKIYARGLVYLVALQFGKNILLNSMGWETDQFSRRYVKPVENEDGTRQEMVVVFSSPLNLYNKYYYGFIAKDPTRDRGKRFVDELAKRIHPLAQVTRRLYDNRDRTGMEIYNPFDEPKKILLDKTAFFIRDSLTVIDMVINSTMPPKKKKELMQQFNKNSGMLWLFLKANTTIYKRETKDKRAMLRINSVEKSFKRLLTKAALRGEPWTQKEMEVRTKSLEKLIRVLLEDIQ